MNKQKQNISKENIKIISTPKFNQSQLEKDFISKSNSPKFDIKSIKDLNSEFKK